MAATVHSMSAMVQRANGTATASARPNTWIARRSSRRQRHAAAAVQVAAVAGGGPLLDPSAGGKRRVVVPQRLDPSKLEDVRQAEAFGPRVSGRSQSQALTAPAKLLAAAGASVARHLAAPTPGCSPTTGSL